MLMFLLWTVLRKGNWKKANNSDSPQQQRFTFIHFRETAVLVMFAAITALSQIPVGPGCSVCSEWAAVWRLLSCSVTSLFPRHASGQVVFCRRFFPAYWWVLVIQFRLSTAELESCSAVTLFDLNLSSLDLNSRRTWGRIKCQFKPTSPFEITV